ncbi:MAG: hypothetical protein PCFJNLEI_01145 [Verrucomicrobiae bacterium]|nr:hypothetical protein [Verrucomicrobiae bacterium]
MKRRAALILLAAAAVFVLHAGFLLWRGERIAAQWVDVDGESALSRYISQRDYLLSFSYAVVAGFTAYAWQSTRERRRAGVVGGITLAGILFWGGCWLVGCCGSPLLPIYLSFFGASFLGFTKPLILVSTLASVALGVWWMKRKEKRGCGCHDPQCKTETTATDGNPVEKIRAEIAEGMNLPKCQQCGCMKDALTQLATPLPAMAGDIAKWQQQMKPIKYACLGCEYCYPAVAMNVLHKAFPETEATASLSCEFEVRPDIWPPVPGEYHEFCEGDSCPVAVSTLASTELADQLAANRTRELCIVGKTETENIGIDKLIKNTITNRSIRYLVVAGREPQGHESGKTLVALATNGVDDSMRVIGSPGKRPILRNVTRDEVETFRRQVQVVDMIGCEDTGQIAAKLNELSAAPLPAAEPPAAVASAPVVKAEPPTRVEMDKAGYFVILPQAGKGVILTEHYDYENRLLRVIEGKDARSIYATILRNGWVTQLSHAAYLGKELTRAEASLRDGSKFVQDGA